MKIIIDIGESGAQATVFAAYHGGVSDGWSEDQFSQYVQTNYPSLSNRVGIDCPFHVASGDTLELDPSGKPVRKIDLPKPDSLDVKCESPQDFDRIPAVPADGKSIHTITVRRMRQNGDMNRSDSFTTIAIRTNQLIPVSISSQKLVSGQATFSVGPSSVPGDVKVTFADKAMALKAMPIAVRFL